MPSWVMDDKIWKGAKAAVKRQRGKKYSDFTDRDWGLVAHIYKQRGGRVTKAKESFDPASFYSEILVEEDREDKERERLKGILARQYGRLFVDDEFMGLVDSLVKAHIAMTKNHTSRQSAIRSCVLRSIQEEGLLEKSKEKYKYVELSADQKKRFKGVTVKQDKDGFFVTTHRCRSKPYSSVDKIPDNDIKYIESTG